MEKQSPYELRFTFLMSAKEYLESKFHAELELFERKITTTAPSFPTEEEIFALAESYKQFVDKK